MNSLNSRVDMDPAMDEIGYIFDVVAPMLPAKVTDITISSTEVADCPSTSGNSSAMNLLNSAYDIEFVGDFGGGIRSSCDGVSSFPAEDAISVGLSWSGLVAICSARSCTPNLSQKSYVPKWLDQNLN